MTRVCSSSFLILWFLAAALWNAKNSIVERSMTQCLRKRSRRLTDSYTVKGRIKLRRPTNTGISCNRLYCTILPVENALRQEKWRMQSKIQENLLVEQETGIFFVLSTPLLELPIQKTLKKTKNWSKTADTCPNQHTIEKGWLSVLPTHLPWRTFIINHCVTIYHTMPCKRSR